MTVSAENIKKLRDLTQAGMLDCKKALQESGGDFDAAVDYLRKKGLALAASKSGRIASEGVVAVCVLNNRGSIAEINSETDFVARNKDFQDLAINITKLACEQKLDYENLLQATYPGSDHNVEQEIVELVAKIKENIKLRRVSHIEIDQGVIAKYIHGTLGSDLGKIGVLIGIRSTSSNSDQLREIGKKVAMHIAAAKPSFLKREDVDSATLEREKNIYVEQAKASGRPDNVIEKMVEGRIKKFYQEIVLLEQNFVMDTKLTIADFIEQEAKQLGAPIEISEFCCFILGEGIEKKVDDFKSEVEAQINK